ncbi:3-oxoacyl-[acyl-carrier protein] reductase [Natrinema hispanicum]|uniref:3-oxoacyl-[acyl-carrier protein] reductase n=1 Tax=Natrinema hispanicum TaxID=392421 RepID=A0A482YA13_9EURY|nr:SDR family oxidoreductase [Natrinema hispanicum]RZV11097.1 3-oxoacyl-[acyl-carrier protein] reductase [Natrinema hispanicum]
MTTLDGETIIVTGASRGLGASMATRFAREGANVVLTARSEADLEAVAADVADAAGETLVAPADVTDEAAVRAVVDATIEEYGTVTGLVNNAGIGLLNMYGEQRVLHEVDADDFRQILDVNVTGVFLFSKCVVPELIDNGRGTIINVSSGLGRRGAAKWGPYVASKWALEGMTRTQADELEEHGITVNAVDPGGRVETGFWEHLPDSERDEILEPDVMNDAATRLLAQGPDGITGESMAADEWERRLA